MMGTVVKRASAFTKIVQKNEIWSGIKPGMSIAVAGFGICGVAENSLMELSKINGINNLHIISNTGHLHDYGIGWLLEKKMVSAISGSYIGENRLFSKLFLQGDARVNWTPQGNLIEKIRAGQAGIKAFYTNTGLGTLLETGGLVQQFDKKGNVVSLSAPKETEVINGKKFLLEEAFTADFSVIKAYQADKQGNLRFRKTARNFNPDVAGLGKCTIAEVEEIVNEIPPEQIHTPGCFVDRIYLGEKFLKRIERVKVDQGGIVTPPEGTKDKLRFNIAKRAMKEILPGMYCNLGVGIPTMVANFVSYLGSKDIRLQGENGLIGVGKYPKKEELDADMINAGKESVNPAHGWSMVRSSESFGCMRGGHLHMTMLGGLQVSEKGDLANWIVPGKVVKGMGGAMDLCAMKLGGSKCVVLMEHCLEDGNPRILKECTYPLTGNRTTSMLITDKAVFEFTDDGMVLMEKVPSISLEDLKKITPASYGSS